MLASEPDMAACAQTPGRYGSCAMLPAALAGPGKARSIMARARACCCQEAAQAAASRPASKRTSLSCTRGLGSPGRLPARMTSEPSGGYTGTTLRGPSGAQGGPSRVKGRARPQSLVWQLAMRRGPRLPDAVLRSQEWPRLRVCLAPPGLHRRGPQAGRVQRAGHAARLACPPSTHLRIMSPAVMLNTLPSRWEAKYSKTCSGKSGA